MLQLELGSAVEKVAATMAELELAGLTAVRLSNRDLRC